MNVQITCDKLGHFFNEQVLFKNFNYSFEKGKMYAFIGHNGCGKSTMLNLLSGDIRPRTGDVKFMIDNQSVLRNELYKNVAICSPSQQMFDEWTGQEAIDFNFKLKKKLNGVSNASDITSLSKKDLKKSIKDYSSGMLQRLKLGIVMNTEANIYYLDEPTMNLDEAGFIWFKDMLNNLPSEAIVLMASNLKHEIELIDVANVISIEKYKP